ncbi:MAG: hypothetical protein KDI64_04295, partial [Candidatus Accumulibacter sp.]|nr:hypothetical protein [Accumulibacter sp.]
MTRTYGRSGVEGAHRSGAAAVARGMDSRVVRSTAPSPGQGVPRFLAARGLKVSRPEDAGERQADRVADAVMAPEGCSGCTPVAPCASCASGIQRSAEGSGGPLSASLPGLGSGRP